jgi:hypothetical protein
MVRISKQTERRNKSPRKHRKPMPKTGPKKDNLPGGFKTHPNAVEGDFAAMAYIAKIR